MTEETLVVAASFQQIDLLRQISEVPESSRLSDSVLVFLLDGCLNVSALSGALEGLIERHPVLRTTINTSGPVPIQEVHVGPLLPVLISQVKAINPAQVADEARASRLSPEEAASGALLFRAAIVACDGVHLLILRIHHLITDAWSDAVMFRDLSELYRAQVEARPPDLPRLMLTYANFARGQHADWPVLRQRVAQHWAKQLSSYPGYIVLPHPAEVPDDPYICEIVTRSLATQANLAVRQAAQKGRVTPFLILVAATVLAIGEVTGQYDLLIGSNVANREALEKRDLIGYFTNTRLMRIDVTSRRNLSEATAVVREQWLAGDDLQDAYIDQVLADLGRPGVIKIDALDLPPSLASAGTLDLPEVMASDLPVRSSEPLRHWRDLNITWVPSQNDGLCIEIRHRLAAVDRETATAIADGAVVILSRLLREEEPVI